MRVPFGELAGRASWGATLPQCFPRGCAAKCFENCYAIFPAIRRLGRVFALFKLNPAPFCILDEVDAPLDDRNVERYCKTLRTLSEVSQLVVITHNKITMESADILLGVTMGEPGVSSIVSVDIDEAVRLAAH